MNVDIVTDEQIEAARIAHAELVQLQQQQLMEQRKAERDAKESVTHSLHLERGSDGRYSGVYTIPGFRIHVLAAVGWDAEGRKKARLYVSGDPDVDFTEAYAMQRDNAAKHGHASYPKGTFPEEDKLFADLNRQVIKNQREIADTAIRASADLHDMLDGVKLHFSRYAGCSCGCSAGFVASHHITLKHDDRTLNVTDIFVAKVVTK